MQRACECSSLTVEFDCCGIATASHKEFRAAFLIRFYGEQYAPTYILRTGTSTRNYDKPVRLGKVQAGYYMSKISSHRGIPEGNYGQQRADRACAYSGWNCRTDHCTNF